MVCGRERERECNVEFIFLDPLKCHYHLGSKKKVQVKVAEGILCDLLNLILMLLQSLPRVKQGLKYSGLMVGNLWY